MGIGGWVQGQNVYRKGLVDPLRGIWDAVIKKGGYGKMQQGEGIMQPSKNLSQIKFGLQFEDLKSEKS